MKLNAIKDTMNKAWVYSCPSSIINIAIQGLYYGLLIMDTCPVGKLEPIHARLSRHLIKDLGDLYQMTSDPTCDFTGVSS